MAVAKESETFWRTNSTTYRHVQIKMCLPLVTISAQLTKTPQSKIPKPKIKILKIKFHIHHHTRWEMHTWEMHT